mmetsp:Transcript_4290/g.13726  ORF Transcript_4290/g.13726 Transcript_4290/m.13726 type:complete len:386 (-) Transcript_4290:3342-4499(-)
MTRLSRLVGDGTPRLERRDERLRLMVARVVLVASDSSSAFLLMKGRRAIISLGKKTSTWYQRRLPKPMATLTTHCSAERGLTLTKRPVNSTSTAWMTPQPTRMPMKRWLLTMPEKTSRSPSSRRALIMLKSCRYTNTLKITVKCCPGASPWWMSQPFLSMSKRSLPLKRSTSSTTTWYTAEPSTKRHISREMMASSLRYGMRSKSAMVGASVARASAPSASMMRFTQRSCTAVRGDTSTVSAPRKATTTAVTLTASWNCTNLRMASYTLRPHMTASTRLRKLSSRRMMSAASLATSVPAIPMANPTSASLRAGASLVPSPVTATTSPISCSAPTRVCLSLGCERASTCSWTTLSRNIFLATPPASAASASAANSGPSMARPTLGW